MHLWEYRGDLGQQHHAHLLVVARDRDDAAEALFDRSPHEDYSGDRWREQRLVRHLLGAYDVEYEADDYGEITERGMAKLRADFVSAVASLPWEHVARITPDDEDRRVLLYDDGGCC